MKNKFMALTLLALLVMLTVYVPSFVVPVQSSSPSITIDGNISDWAGITPVATDPLGDTEAWSKNATLLTLSNVLTAEVASGQDNITANDMARDLKALYVTSNDTYIFLRLDVRGLYSGVFATSTKYCPWHSTKSVTYGNITEYTFLFDVVPFAGCKVAPPCMEIDMNYTANALEAWDWSLKFDGYVYCTYSTGEYSSSPWTELNAYGTGYLSAIDYANGAIEIALNRTVLRGKYGALIDGIVNMFVYSYKPGEICENSTAPEADHWVHAFDPTHPGCPGGCAWDGYCVNYPYGPGPRGPDNSSHPDAGSDHADYFEVMGTLAPPNQYTARSQFVGPRFGVDMSAGAKWVGVTPLATDDEGDTEAWSKNATLLSQPYIMTAERYDDVTTNDKARDLKTLYLSLQDPDWICFKLEVAGLYQGVFARSPHTCNGTFYNSTDGKWYSYPHDPETLNYPNVTAYVILFDLTPGATNNVNSCKVAPPYMDIDMNPTYGVSTPPYARWDFYIQFDGAVFSEYSQGEYSKAEWTELNAWSKSAVNYTAGTIDIQIKRSVIEAKYGLLGIANLFVYSYKPGEMHEGVTGVFHTVHAFDPQHPGCPGGGAWDFCISNPQNPGVQNGPNTPAHPDAGSDHADYFNVMGSVELPPTHEYRSFYEGPTFPVMLGLTKGPTAKFTHVPRAPQVNETVTFNASASEPGFNVTTRNIVGYAWNWGDGTQNTTANPITTHSFTAKGFYNVTLTVTCEGVTPNTDTTWKLLYVSPLIGIRNITADGDLSDWDGLEALYVDEEGDLQPWCTNLTLLNSAIFPQSSPENATLNAANNEARDLKALYVASNDTHVFFRLDVKGLPSAFWGDGNEILNRTTGLPYNITETGPASKYYNASVYMIFIDTNFIPGSGGNELDSATDTLSPYDAYWERRIYLPNGTSISIQEPTEWATISTNATCGMNVTAGSLEMAIPRTAFPTDWDGQSINIWVTSHKPGECFGGTYVGGNWTRAFDPQAPGTPGEPFGVPGENASGSDIADLMPGNVSGIEVLTSGERKGKVLRYLTVPTPSAPHGLSVTNVEAPAFAFTTWGTVKLNVTVKNTGSFLESFTVTVYANSTPVAASQNVNNLAPGANINLTFSWSVSGIYVPSVKETGTPYPGPPKFLISVNITGAVTVWHNNGYVQIRHAGDTDADGKCYTLDFSNLVVAFREGTKPDKPFNSPQCDFDGDKKVYTLDFSIMVSNYRWGTK